VTGVKRNRYNGKIVIRRSTSAKRWLNFVLFVLVLLTVWGFADIDTKGVPLGEASVQTLKYFGTMFGSPRGIGSHFEAASDHGFDVFIAALKVLLVTLALAFLTTLLGAIFALILGLLAARNLTNARVSNAIKAFIAVIRAVPTVLWVLIFAIGAGLGAVAAVIGMSFHTVGYLLKAYSESFEELDEGVIEALRASGANWIQIVFQAVIPSSVTYLLSWTFIRFEINFAVAVAMGAAAGAGGIGYQLFMSAGYFFDIREIGFITYLILGVALIMELIATKLKERYHIHE
jgi:phosphonate transport system permease protein